MNIESKSSILAIQQHMQTERMRDSWWLNYNGDTLDRPLPLSAVIRTIKQRPAGHYMILNVVETESEDPPWIEVDHGHGLGSSRLSGSFSELANVPTPPSEYDQAVVKAQVSPAESIDSAQILERLARLEESQQLMMDSIQGLHKLVKSVAYSISKEEELAERETFVNKAEERIIEETHRLDEERAEVDQLRDELVSKSSLKVVGE